MAKRDEELARERAERTGAPYRMVPEGGGYVMRSKDAK